MKSKSKLKSKLNIFDVFVYVTYIGLIILSGYVCWNFMPNPPKIGQMFRWVIFGFTVLILIISLMSSHLPIKLENGDYAKIIFFWICWYILPILVFTLCMVVIKPFESLQIALVLGTGFFFYFVQFIGKNSNLFRVIRR